MDLSHAYAAVKYLHIGLGALALAAFWAAGLSRKGGPLHRSAGQVSLLAIAGVIATGAPMAAYALHRGHAVAAAFLAYLLTINATAAWTGWRAIADKRDARRYTGPVFVALAALCLLSGAAMLALGAARGQPLLLGFSTIGLIVGADMLRKRLRRDALAARPRWWLFEHYQAMLGNGIAVHVAFLGIGLPRLLPWIDGAALHYAAWFGPVLAAAAAKLWLDRRWRAPAAAHGAAAPKHIGGAKESVLR